VSGNRSIRDRRRELLRRFLPTRGAAMLALSIVACASSSTRDAQVSSADAAFNAPQVEQEYLDDWTPPRLPLEIEISPELRSACQPLTEPPSPIVLEQSEGLADELEPLAACLTLGPLADRAVHLFGETEAPGALAAPIQAGGAADQLRSALSLTGVPFENIVTHHVDGGSLVEVAIEASAS
jgi:hypothetical protein